MSRSPFHGDGELARRGQADEVRGTVEVAIVERILHRARAWVDDFSFEARTLDGGDAHFVVMTKHEEFLIRRHRKVFDACVVCLVFVLNDDARGFVRLGVEKIERLFAKFQLIL